MTNRQRPCSQCVGVQTEYSTDWHCHRCGHQSEKKMTDGERRQAIDKANEPYKHIPGFKSATENLVHYKTSMD